MNIAVIVEDADDSEPEFLNSASWNFAVNENTPNGDELRPYIVVSDPDTGIPKELQTYTFELV